MSRTTGGEHDDPGYDEAAPSRAPQPLGMPGRRGHRRVTAPGTSGQPEEIESQIYDPLHGEQNYRAGNHDSRAEWLKAEKPPHWG